MRLKQFDSLEGYCGRSAVLWSFRHGSKDWLRMTALLSGKWTVRYLYILFLYWLWRVPFRIGRKRTAIGKVWFAGKYLSLQFSFRLVNWLERQKQRWNLKHSYILIHFFLNLPSVSPSICWPSANNIGRSRLYLMNSAAEWDHVRLKLFISIFYYWKQNNISSSWIQWIFSDQYNDHRG